MDTNRTLLVLLTENNALVGIDLCEALVEAGYRVVGPVATVAETEALLANQAIDLAIIEPFLRDGDCTDTMRQLRRRGVPFVVHASCGRDDPLALGFTDAPWLTNPAVPRDVVITLGDIAFGSS